MRRFDTRAWFGGLVCAAMGAVMVVSGAARGEPEKSDGKDSGSVTGAVLKVVPGTKVKLACDTNAIGMDTEPFKTSNGVLSLELSFAKAAPNGSDGGASVATDDASVATDDAPVATDDNALGTWIGSATVLDHKASLGIITKQVCQAGCVLRGVPSGNLELWAPRPVMPAKLGEGETVTLAALDVATLEFKATVFRGNQLSILENGKCKLVTP